MLKLPEEHIEIAEQSKNDKWYWRQLPHLPEEIIELYELERTQKNETVRFENK
jgi:hypothetical protein